jgi:hypothetical protein
MIRVVKAVLCAAQPGGTTRIYFEKERSWEAKIRQGFSEITGAIAANKAGAQLAAIDLLQDMGKRYKAIWSDTKIKYPVFYDCMYQAVDRRSWWIGPPPRLFGATDEEVEAIAETLKEALSLFTQRGDGRNYSLLSKWLHFCVPDTFAIYDSHAAESVETVSRTVSLRLARDAIQPTHFLREAISDTSGKGYLGLLDFYRLLWDTVSSAGMTGQIQHESDEIQSLLRAETGCGSARVTPLTFVDMLLWMSNGSPRQLGLAGDGREQVLKPPNPGNLPQIPEQRSPSKSGETPDDRRGSRALGDLRIANNAHKSTTVFVGHIACSRCSSPIEIEVERNPNAVLSKHPPFVINMVGPTSVERPIGHLFVGTILTSPVLYYGSMNHCGADQRIRVFFNRSLRDRADHHLTIMSSTSVSPESSSASNQ